MSLSCRFFYFYCQLPSNLNVCKVMSTSRSVSMASLPSPVGCLSGSLALLHEASTSPAGQNLIYMHVAVKTMETTFQSFFSVSCKTQTLKCWCVWQSEHFRVRAALRASSALGGVSWSDVTSSESFDCKKKKQPEGENGEQTVDPM